MLQQHAVPGHQAGDGIADHLIGGKIPRLDAVDHADRRIGDDAARRIAGIAFFVGQLLRPGGGGIVADAGAQLDLVTAVADQLADLARH